MKASVLFEQGTPLSVEELDLEPPRTGEVAVPFFAARQKTPVRSLRFCGHSRELAQRVKRAERDQFKTHQMSPPQR